MPFVRVTTSSREPSQPVDQQALLRNVTALTAQHLGKPPQYVMAQLSLGVPMAFANSDQPCAHVGVHGIGTPTPEQTGALTKALCDELERSLKVGQSRVFVVFVLVPRELWGMNGRMLG